MPGQITKRGDKTWMVRIFMGRDGQGKRRYLNKTIRGTKKKANEYLSKTLTEISSGTFVKSSADSVEAYLEKWLETAARPRLRETLSRVQGAYSEVREAGFRSAPLVRLASLRYSKLLHQTD